MCMSYGPFRTRLPRPEANFTKSLYEELKDKERRQTKDGRFRISKGLGKEETQERTGTVLFL